MNIDTRSIQVQLPDGSARTVPAGTTPLAIAADISPRLATAAVVAQIRPAHGTAASTTAETESANEATMYKAEDAASERLVDLTAPLEEDVTLRLLTEKDVEALKVVRHSAAHVMATAVLELFPETKLGHGPATDSGFFYDFYRPTPFTPEDLKAIEERMAVIVARDEKFVREWEPRDEGLLRFKAENDFMKMHFIERFTVPGEKISLYRNGAFVDFCRGPHVPSTSRVKAFKVMSIAGAYWLGDEKNPQLQRIYGTAFFSQKEMDEHFARLEEAQRRDHRVLGKQLDLFSIQDIAGPGLVFWHPKGGIIRKLMEDWMREECIRRGYDMVFTPHVMRHELWKISGHAGFYAQNMYTPIELDDADYQLKPMNCPGHILIYKNTPKSYRDLPVRYAELGNVYRYERSGTMHGLLRVRGFTQDDAHIFCTPDQIEDEVGACIEFADAVLKTFGFAEFKVELSIWDPKDKTSYVGSEDNWALAIGSLERVLQRKGIPYKTIVGEAAFYGPKIDIKLVDALGRLWQLSTVQFDFNLPARFELEYVGEDGERHQPVMVHRALFGSVERFFGVLIEHYAGAFPLWLAPVQVGLVPISEKHIDYAKKVQSQLQMTGLRVELDDRNEKMNAKIRDLTMQKIPYVLIMGDKEAAANAVSVRTRGKGDQGSMPLTSFIIKAKWLVEVKATELLGGNQQLFGPLARKYLSDNEWADMYPDRDSFAEELETLLGMLEIENQLDRYLPRLKTKQQKRDEALAELRVAYFFKRSGYRVVEWEPKGNTVNSNIKRGEFSLARNGEPTFFVEVKSPGWEGELSRQEMDAGRTNLPKYIPGKVVGGAVSPNDAIQKTIDKAYEKFLDSCPNLLVIADDLHFPLKFFGEDYGKIPFYDTKGGYGALGYFTSKKYERLGGVAILGFADLPTYYYRVYENPYALEACKLPRSVIELKEGE